MSISDVQEIPCLSQNPNVCLCRFTAGCDPETDMYTQNLNIKIIFGPIFLSAMTGNSGALFSFGFLIKIVHAFSSPPFSLHAQLIPSTTV